MLKFFHVQRASLREITRNNKHKNIYFSVVCFEFFVSLEKFSLNSRHHFCRRRAGNFDLCSALMVNEQWGFFSGRHHLWQGAYVYNGHFWNTWGLVTFTPNPSVWQWSCQYLTFRSVAARTPILRLARQYLR